MSKKCGEKTEVYSRVTGYFRPVANWNRGKQQEFADRKTYNVGKAVLILSALMVLALGAGCGSTSRKMTESASGKNLGLDGYVMLGELETANPETATPQGKIIVGRVTYKSRKVGIPADQKVPTTGYFKATATESLFGTKETIIEYDFTAGSDADAKKAEEALKAKRAAAEKAFADAEKKKAETEAAKKSTSAAVSTPGAPAAVEASTSGAPAAAAAPPSPAAETGNR